MKKIPEDIIIKFLSGKRLSDNEYAILEDFFNNNQYKKELNNLLRETWQKSLPIDTGLQYEAIHQKIKVLSVTRRNRFLIILAKAAAVLLIPLFVFTMYFFSSRNYNNEMLTISTQKGEFTNIILPDGSKVWLNVDSRLSYPLNYGVKSRKLKLEGEAYFEVEQDEFLPFIVTSGRLTTTALGTQFTISAYYDSSILKSSLIEGSIIIDYGDDQRILKPGQQLIVDKERKHYFIHSFNEEYELAWKNNQLIFQLTPFDRVIAELEKWYGINIEYNPNSFNSETLTVRFEKYESLENVLKVISKAIGFEYKVKGKNIEISKINT